MLSRTVDSNRQSAALHKMTKVSSAGLASPELHSVDLRTCSPAGSPPGVEGDGCAGCGVLCGCSADGGAAKGMAGNRKALHVQPACT